MGVYGLDQFGLGEASFRRLGSREATAEVHLRTYDLTPAVRRLPPSKRRAYLVARVGRWIEGLRRMHPTLSFRTGPGKLADESTRKLSQLPSSVTVKGPARKVLALSKATAVSSVYITRVEGYRRRHSPKSPLEWHCVRAFVVIPVEHATSGRQRTEDRFILVRAASCDDAKKRIAEQWREYAKPYLNSDFAMVSWRLDHIVDVYQTSVTEIDPAGTEIYSKLGNRRMCPKYVWRP